jgi:hypothetical protein
MCQDYCVLFSFILLFIVSPVFPTPQFSAILYHLSTTILSALHLLNIFTKNKLTIYVYVYFQTFHSLPLNNMSIILTTLYLLVQMQSKSPNLFFFLKLFRDSYFLWHSNFIINLSIS